LDGDLTTATLSESGFSFAGLTPGSHTLTTESPGYAGSAESISAISGEVTRTDKIQLRAFNPGTLRINNLTGGIATIDVETQQLVDNPAGDFAKWLMPAGDYQLRAWTTACQGVAAAEVTIQPGQFVSLDVICTLNTVGYMSR
jgi:hypothetical protein